jgi:transcription elongation factor Elf1
MSLFSIKLRTTDRLWTRYKRIKEKFTCQKCGRAYLSESCANLQVAHFHGRGHENVRFDEQNTLCLCGIPCHRYFDTHKTEFEEFMLKRLGREAYDLLDLRAHIYKKRDDRADMIIIKELLKEVA